MKNLLVICPRPVVGQEKQKSNRVEVTNRSDAMYLMGKMTDCDETFVK